MGEAGNRLIAAAKEALDMTDYEEAVETKEFLGSFARFIVKFYGERCPDVEGGCPKCSMWALYDLTVAMICVPYDLPEPPTDKP